jgi:hypothetical protein
MDEQRPSKYVTDWLRRITQEGMDRLPDVLKGPIHEGATFNLHALLIDRYVREHHAEMKRENEALRARLAEAERERDWLVEMVKALQ